MENLVSISTLRKAKKDVTLTEKIMSYLRRLPRGRYIRQSLILKNCLRADNATVLSMAMDHFEVGLKDALYLDSDNGRSSMAIFYWAIYHNAQRCIEMLINEKGQTWFPDRNPAYPDHRLVNIHEGRLEVHDITLLCAGKMSLLRKTLEKYPMDIDSLKMEPYPLSDFLSEYEVTVDDIWQLKSSRLSTSYPMTTISTYVDMFLSEALDALSSNAYRQFKKQIFSYRNDLKTNAVSREFFETLWEEQNVIYAFLYKLTGINSKTRKQQLMTFFKRLFQTELDNYLSKLSCREMVKMLSHSGKSEVLVYLNTFVGDDILSRFSATKLINATKDTNELQSVLLFLGVTPIKALENRKITEKRKVLLLSLLSK